MIKNVSLLKLCENKNDSFKNKSENSNIDNRSENININNRSENNNNNNQSINKNIQSQPFVYNQIQLEDKNNHNLNISVYDDNNISPTGMKMKPQDQNSDNQNSNDQNSNNQNSKYSSNLKKEHKNDEVFQECGCVIF